MEDEFEQLSDQESLEAEFDKIRNARVHEILVSLKSLYVIINAFIQYTKYEEDADFSSAIKRINDSLNSEEKKEVFRYFAVPGNIGSMDPMTFEELKKYYAQIIEMVSSPDYKPPDIAQDIYDHLLTLYFHYSIHYLKHNYLLWDMRIDLSLFKVLKRASLAFYDLKRKGKCDIERTRSTIKTLKTNAKKRSEHIIQLLPHIKKKHAGGKITLRAMALDIQKDWKNFPPEDPAIKKIPGLTLISQILEKTGEFEKVGGLWILKM